jgi:hypothetical protein
MIRMFVRHPVQDYSAWKKNYDGFEPHRKEMGVLAHEVFTDPGNDCDVTVTHDFETLEQAQRFAQSSTLGEAMKTAGVVGPATIWFTTPTE